MSALYRSLQCLAAGCLLSISSTGCLTIQPNSSPFSLKSILKQDSTKIAQENVVDEVPSKPKNPAQLKLAYAKLMEESGNHPEAHKHYREAVKLQSNNIEAIAGLARLEQTIGNIDEAEKGFKKAVKIAPDSAIAQFNLGQFYASQDQWDQAAEHMKKAMLAAPYESEYRYHLAVALVQTGDVHSALPHFIRTIGDAEGHYNVGLILKDQGKLDEAERHLALAVTKKPELKQAQSWLAHIREIRTQERPIHSDGSGDLQSPLLPAGHSAAFSTSAITPRSDDQSAPLS